MRLARGRFVEKTTPPQNRSEKMKDAGISMFIKFLAESV
jgi:hypothetical protein